MRTLTYANVASSLALVVALGGTGYAAVNLPKNSVGTKQLKSQSVTAAKIKKASISAKQLKPGVIPVVPPTVPGYVPGTTLKSGQTLTGVFAASGPSGLQTAVISFHPRLAAPITSNAFRQHLNVGVTTVECPGPGQAMAGFFCAYDKFSSMAYVTMSNPATGTDTGVAQDGIVIDFSSDATNDIVTGVWAVTAP